jgi:hypothetical protein
MIPLGTIDVRQTPSDTAAIERDALKLLPRIKTG